MLLMRIYVFVSRKDPDFVAFTLSATGENLPISLGPWFEESIPGMSVADIDCDPITEAVRREGYFIATDRVSD
jgi:hypothetical protein